MSPNSLPLQNCIVSALKGTFPRTQPPPSHPTTRRCPLVTSLKEAIPHSQPSPPLRGDLSQGTTFPWRGRGFHGLQQKPWCRAGAGGRRALQGDAESHGAGQESPVSPIPWTAVRPVPTSRLDPPGTASGSLLQATNSQMDWPRRWAFRGPVDGAGLCRPALERGPHSQRLRDCEAVKPAPRPPLAEDARLRGWRPGPRGAPLPCARLPHLPPADQQPPEKPFWLLGARVHTCLHAGAHATHTCTHVNFVHRTAVCPETGRTPQGLSTPMSPGL